MLNKLKDELEKRGHKVRLRDDAVEIDKGDWSFVVRQNTEWDDIKAVADDIEKELGTSNVAAVALEKISDPEYIRNHVRLCIRPQTNDHIVKMYYLDLEIYPLLVFEEGMCSVITPKLAKLVEDTLEYAIANSENSYVTEELSMYAPHTAELIPDSIIVRTEDMRYGASALYYRNIFEKYCKEKGIEECVIIPTSVHEIIVGPHTEIRKDMKEFLEKQNGSIADKDFLSNNLYKYSLISHKVEVM